MQIDPFLSPCTKLESKWIKDLHIKLDTLNLIEEKVGESLKHMGTGEKFLNRTPMAYALRSRIGKWDLIKLQSFCKAKNTVNRTKQQPSDWEKIFTNPTFDRYLIERSVFRIHEIATISPLSDVQLVKIFSQSVFFFVLLTVSFAL